MADHPVGVGPPPCRRCLRCCYVFLLPPLYGCRNYPGSGPELVRGK